MSIGCQRLRLEVDDLRLRCGEDANLVDVAQWIEPFSDFGKPKSSSVRAAVIGDDLSIEKLPVSSKGCIAVPASLTGWRWLAVRSEEAGAFGKVLLPSPERYRRVQLEALPGSFPRFDCPKSVQPDRLPLSLVFQDRWLPEHLLLRMELSDGKGTVGKPDVLQLSGQAGDQYGFDLTKLPEGVYEARVRVVNLLNVGDGLKGFERVCGVQVDRTVPVAALTLRNGSDAADETKTLRLNPGESVDVKITDASTSRVSSCWLKKSETKDCEAFVEAGNRLSAPNEGEWSLSFFVTDDAGNKSAIKKFAITIFDADRVGRIVEWIELAKAHLKEEDNFSALQQIYKATRAMSELKTKSEWVYVRNKVRAPFLSLLGRNVPIQKIANEEGILDSIYAVSPSTLVTHSSGERRWGHILKLFDFSGKMLKRLQFEDKTLLAFDDYKKQLMVWKLDDQVEVYDDALKQETAFAVNKEDEPNEREIRDLANGQALIRKGKSWFHVDVDKNSETRLTDVQADGKQAALSFDGKWLIVKSGEGFSLRNLATGEDWFKSLPAPLDEVKFARFADTACLKAGQNLWCGDAESIVTDVFDIKSDDAQGIFDLDGTGQYFVYQGTKRVYERSRSANTHFYYPLLKKVLDLYYVGTTANVYTPEGTEYLFLLPPEPTQPKPYNPDFLPKKNEFRTDRGHILFENDSYLGKVKLSFRQKDGRYMPFYYPLDPKRYTISSLASTPDGQYLLAINRDQQLEILPIVSTIFQKYNRPCRWVSPSAESCLSLEDNKLYYIKFTDRHFNFKDRIKLDSLPIYETYWHPTRPDIFALYYDQEFVVWDLKNGVPKRSFQVKAPGSLSLVSWLTDRWVSIYGGDNYLAVWDFESGEKIFEATPDLGYESQMYNPVDFSAILNVFAVVGKDDNGTPVLRLWNKGEPKPYAQHVFEEPDTEWAQILKFQQNTPLLMIGFHHGYVHVVKDAKQALKKGNIDLVQSHEDIVVSMGYMPDGRTAYSMSADGSAVMHDLFGSFESHQLFKTKAIANGGWLPEDELFWASTVDRDLIFFDKSGKIVDTVQNLGEAEMTPARVSVDGGGFTHMIIDWNQFDVWQQLSEWAPALLAL